MNDPSSFGSMLRVLVIHNRYRFEGGEERSVALHTRALENAGVPWHLLERRSAGASRTAAGAALVRGGSNEDGIAAAVREFEADVVHAHNIHPLIGPRGLAAARKAGASVVLHLHNLRIFCAIGVASRDRQPCLRCRGRFTLPGLALNCRRSLPQALSYSLGLALHQPTLWRAVDRFVAPSRSAADQLVRFGVPSERIEVVAHYLPSQDFGERSQADRGRYALFAGRLAIEKGIDTAIEAADVAGIPLRIAGQGPLANELGAMVSRLRAPVQLLGRLEQRELKAELAGAAMLVLPSRYHEFAPYAALEAMAAGVPVVATSLGALPELIGEERCLPPNDAAALAGRMTALWQDTERRKREGNALLAAARARHAEERYRQALADLYAEIVRRRSRSN